MTISPYIKELYKKISGHKSHPVDLQDGSLEIFKEKEINESEIEITFSSYNTPWEEYKKNPREYILQKIYLNHPQAVQATVCIPKLFDYPTSYKFPLVVLSPGGTNISQTPASKEKFVSLFRKLGFYVIIADHFTTRGIKETTYEEVKLLPIESSFIDLAELIKLFSNHPQIDKDKIFIAGFSRGALVVFFALLAEYLNTVLPSIKPRAILSFYPIIFAQPEDINLVTQIPTLLVVGEKDDLCEPNSAISFAKSASTEKETSSAQVKTLVGKNARHGFNVPEFSGIMLTLMNLLYDAHNYFETFPFLQKIVDSVAYLLGLPVGFKGLHQIHNLSNCCLLYTDEGFWHLPTGERYNKGKFFKWTEYEKFIEFYQKRGGHIAYNKAADEETLAKIESFIKSELNSQDQLTEINSQSSKTLPIFSLT